MLFIYINNKDVKHLLKYYLFKKSNKDIIRRKNTHIQGNKCDPGVSNGIMLTL